MNITDKQKKTIHLVSDIVVSIMLFITGILFSVSCYSVYKSADRQMFTYESIGKAFDKIDVAVYIALAIFVLGGIVSVIFPKDEVKLRSPKRIKPIYNNLLKRVDVNDVQDDLRSSIMRERKKRKILLVISAVIIVLEVVLPLIYFLNPKSLPAENGKYNREVMNGILLYVCMLVPLIVYEIIYFIFANRSRVHETELLKEAIKGGASTPEVPDESEKILPKVSKFFEKNEKPITLGVRIAFIGCAVLFIVLGIVNGGMGDVLVKAVNICAECIGLG